MDIDFVVSWVDMSDPGWQADFTEWRRREGGSRNGLSEARFRDNGLLKYWFRGVEKMCPWVRRIHFVTCGQKPSWLDCSNPRLNLVNHSDYIPAEYLPTFNSSVIELHLHRIPGLAGRFVYFNDDVFAIAPVPQERFFSEDGLPRDIAAFRFNFGTGLWNSCLRNNMRLINRRFDKRQVLDEFSGKWFSAEYDGRDALTRLLRPCGKFPTFKIPHNAQPYLKETFGQVWDCAAEELEKASAHRFRSSEDYTQELMRGWQLCSGSFEPCNTYRDTRMFPLLMKATQAVEAVREQKYRLVCLNDNARIKNYDAVMAELSQAFDSILPDKSSFEL